MNTKAQGKHMLTGPIIYPPHPITFEQYMAEEQVKRRYDIVNGVRVFAVPPSLRHQDMLGNFLSLLHNYAGQRGYVTLYSLFDVLISWEPFCTRQPDVMLVSRTLLQAHKDGEPSSIAPRLVVEILSSIDRELALENKILDFSAIGVQECWIVRPESHTIEVMCAIAEGFEAAQTYGVGEIVHSSACQNLTVSVGEILSV